MNDIERLREAIRRELDGLQPSPPTRGFLKRARRRRAGHVAGVALLSVAVLVAIVLPLKALAPLGDRGGRIRPVGTPNADDLTGQELVDALGLVAQDELPEGCKSYAVPPWSAPKGFCLDGHYTTESESWQLSERLRGIVPSAIDINVYELALQLADAKVRNDAEATASLQEQIRALTQDRTVAGTFPAGDPKSCPEQLPSAGADGVQQEITKTLMLTADSGRWPWEDVDAGTQALFASQEDYESALSGSSFDLSIMSSVPSGSGDAVASIVESACGPGVWRTYFVGVRAELLRNGDKQAVDLFFVSRPEGPKLWLAIPAEAKYWVDGAIPARNADAGTGKGCVQYSADRPDVHVCSPDASRDWVPAPAPYYDAEICAAALDWYHASRAPGVPAFAKLDPRFPVAAEAQRAPAIDPASCLVLEPDGTPERQTLWWSIVFKAKTEPRTNVDFPYDPNAG
jgi:hypothetical protein